MFELKNIKYQFSPSPDSQVIKGVDISLSSDDRFGIIGANGCGKSTLLKIVSSLLRPTEGKILWKGLEVVKNLNKYRAAINYEEFGSQGFYPRLNAIENLRFFSALKGTLLSPKQCHQMLGDVGLEEAAWHKHFSDYSLGMKQRLHLARAMLPGAEIILLDEPTNGLDHEGRLLAADLCIKASIGKILLVVSHDKAFLDIVANRTAKMRHGILTETV